MTKTKGGGTGKNEKVVKKKCEKSAPKSANGPSQFVDVLQQEDPWLGMTSFRGCRESKTLDIAESFLLSKRGAGGGGGGGGVGGGGCCYGWGSLHFGVLWEGRGVANLWFPGAYFFFDAGSPYSKKAGRRPLSPKRTDKRTPSLGLQGRRENIPKEGRKKPRRGLKMSDLMISKRRKKTDRRERRKGG